jgi:hypothetical protein
MRGPAATASNTAKPRVTGFRRQEWAYKEGVVLTTWQHLMILRTIRVTQLQRQTAQRCRQCKQQVKMLHMTFVSKQPDYCC